VGDASLREKQRLWQQTAAPDDGRRYLEALRRSGSNEVEILKVRSAIGDVAPLRLRIAAYLDHPPSRKALGRDAPRRSRDLETWLEELYPTVGRLPHPAYFPDALVRGVPLEADWGRIQEWTDENAPFALEAVMRVPRDRRSKCRGQRAPSVGEGSNDDP
jgi:hypothetical protein